MRQLVRQSYDNTRFAWVRLFRDGQLQRITFFQDRADALKVLGLRE